MRFLRNYLQEKASRDKFHISDTAYYACWGSRFLDYYVTTAIEDDSIKTIVRYRKDGVVVFSLRYTLDDRNNMFTVRNMHGECVKNDWDDQYRNGDNYIAYDFVLFETEQDLDIMLCRYCGKSQSCTYEHDKSSADICFFQNYHINICKKTRRQTVTMMHILLVFAMYTLTPYRIEYILEKCFG